MENTKNKVYPNIKESFLAILILFGVTLIVQTLSYFLKHVFSSSFVNSNYFYISSEIFNYALSFGITIKILLNKKRKSEQALFRLWNKGIIDIPIIAILILLTLFLGIIIEPIEKIVPSPKWLNDVLFNEFKKLIQPNILSFISISILPAIFEELIFRRIILDGLLKNYKPVIGILISSLVFGIMHLNPVQFVTGFIIGSFLGWVYWRTKSILACMIIHATNNAIVFFLALKFGLEMNTLKLVGTANYVFLIIFAIMGFVFGFIWLSKKLKSIEFKNQELISQL